MLTRTVWEPSHRCWLWVRTGTLTRSTPARPGQTTSPVWATSSTMDTHIICAYHALLSVHQLTGCLVSFRLTLWRLLLSYGYSYKDPVADRVKPYNFWHPASERPDIKNYKWRLNPVWHRMLYSCTHMTTVGVKGLTGPCWRQMCQASDDIFIW